MSISDIFWIIVVVVWLFLPALLGAEKGKKISREENDRLDSWIKEGRCLKDIFIEFLDADILSFGDILSKVSEGVVIVVDEIGKIAKDLEVDFSDSDTRSGIDLPLEWTIKLFRAAEVENTDIAVYILEDWNDSLSTMMKAFLEAGFTQKEMLDAFFEAIDIAYPEDEEYSDGDVVAAALDLKISHKDISDALSKWDIDVDDLDDEMHDADIDFKDRVRILAPLLEKDSEEIPQNAGITAGLV